MAGRAPGAPDPPQPFHWALEFPEVFERENGGFDAIVGNPPFLGGSRISWMPRAPPTASTFLLRALGECDVGNPDLVAFFLLRAASSARGGTFRLLSNEHGCPRRAHG